MRFSLPIAAKYIAEVSPEKMKIVASAMGIKFDDNTSAKELGNKASNEFRKIQKGLGLSLLADLNLSDEDIGEIADIAIQDTCSMLCPRREGASWGAVPTGCGAAS